MNIDYKSIIRNAILLFVLILVQKSLVWFISLSQLNLSPDLVIIALIYIGVREGKISGAVYGFVAGLLLDVLSGSFLGLLALSYTVSAFIAGFFQTENDRFLVRFNFIIAVFAISILSNFIYFGLFFQGTPILFAKVMLLYIFPSSTYTTIISLVYTILPKKKGYDRSYLSES
ncbi:MAG: rod shape-determining protein MreD [Ignavibacteriae bacterium]|nr:rod shape-determining protein MreD [Ignavibacteriota bacterium]